MIPPTHRHPKIDTHTDIPPSEVHIQHLVLPIERQTQVCLRRIVCLEEVGIIAAAFARESVEAENDIVGGTRGVAAIRGLWPTGVDVVDVDGG